MNETVPAQDQGEEMHYRAAVGPRADKYVPQFLRFDRPGSTRASWHWPAFFVSFYWLLYRRMFWQAVVYLVGAMLLGFVCSLAFVAALGERNGTLAALAVSLAVCFIAIPIVAKALYHSHIKRRIAKVTQSGLDNLQALRALERGPQTSAVVLIVFLAVSIVYVGILAAIAIPAYQDYTIRAQVTAGLNLASAAKAAVAESYAEHGSWPANLTDAGMTAAPTGKYVTSVTINHGTVNIEYGNATHASIAGEILSIRPTVSAEGDVVWTCGYALVRTDDPSTGAAAPDGTSITQKYLPRSCRG
jgi:Tfp pilus assembly major pilin PilA